MSASEHPSIASLPVKPGKAKLLNAAQLILESKGIEGLNSNSICTQAGVTPPTFYHHFKNKHELLRDLGQQMMDEQSAILRADTGLKIRTEDELYNASLNSITSSYTATKEFVGGYALLASMRALPVLRQVRLESMHTMSHVLTDYFIELGFDVVHDAMLVKTRLGLEFGYAAIELLFETHFANEQQVLERTAQSIVSVYGLF